MKLLSSKFSWYFKNISNLIVASLRSLIYCLLHPKELYRFLFAYFSSINQFYQHQFGLLINFDETKMCRDLKDNLVFAKSNIFNLDHNVMRPAEIQILSNLVSFLQPKTIFEIGTYSGFTTLHFANNAPEDTIIYTLDLPEDYVFNDKNKKDFSGYSYDDMLVVQLSAKNKNNRVYKNTSHSDKIIELFGDSFNFDYSKYHNKIDLVFIDGNHSYKYVKSDTENAFKLLSKNGVIIWHDYDYIVHRDVFKYLNQLIESHKIYSIPYSRFAIYGPCL